MKVVTLMVPLCDNYWDVAELTKEEHGCSTEEEYLAYLALRGICADFHDEDTARLMSDYFKELVRMVYTRDLAGEPRQASEEDSCAGCLFENGTRADCCERRRRMGDMHTPKQEGGAEHDA